MRIQVGLSGMNHSGRRVLKCFLHCEAARAPLLIELDQNRVLGRDVFLAGQTHMKRYVHTRKSIVRSTGAQWAMGDGSTCMGRRLRRMWAPTW